MGNSSSMPEQIPDQELLRETFHKIIEIFPELGISRKSPKFFILYAHDNEELNIEANRNVVDDYISWFMSVRLNVDSDKSPNGYGLVNGPAHSGATSDIVRNQVCLLPPSFHHLNVKYVLVFYSRLLAKYMKDERDWKGDTQTYSEALYKACEKYERESKIPWNEVCDTVEQVQQEYYAKMGPLLFHQSLTELALLKYRNKSTKSKYTIPILLFDEKEEEADLKWLPEFVGMKSTGIQIRTEPGKHYHAFFKILSMFEEFEMDRPLIIAMEKCFKKMVDILIKKTMTREQYQLELTINIAKAVREVGRTDMYWMVDKSVPTKDAKDILLESLYKEEVFYRQNDDSLDPFQNTFNWLWGEKPNFRDWLQSGNGIYWISGLPGSGKR